ncbi:cyclic AMP response element-binding protein B isoform X1 [Bombyx mandarina]|uniref:Cyclic AMP response element-binding protein B n=2 Tax=Bombyx TaxID=7090 RepID=A0A8R2HMX0_BOMMO|nr:cAMP responsive element binding protein isoform X1 [Bombyx mori]XP_012544665.1 cAMP responsive element binding protein isoform X1 [Bombyx mori]XP_021202732.1 cAMP responsive element binding protein isoform X1 [Bombyx mori]XP_028041638.1 cyclic AMP response element-binding protein B isoform X1 [Bombyx mandarina]XP_028041639.1 cyclic AMP response element-binding protein B isoform X1 [Bombyx mandarina]XP_028041640.1 cyclic AMP response element-binding protein B isoform X1 [Bombyx mandarina]
MEGMVEENGTTGGAGTTDPLASASSSTPGSTPHVVTSIVQLTLPSQAPSAQVQSVIQPNQQSVIQTASNIQSVQIPKGNVILVSKPSSVIHTTQGTLQTLQIKPEPNTLVNTQGQSCSDESCGSGDESPKRKYREMLTRRPSYRKILNDLGGAEIADNRMGSRPGCETEVSLSPSLSFAPVIPAGTIQTDSGLHTLAVSGAAGGGAIVQYAANQDGQFYVPGPILEDQTRKRELRLMKNREAARECRRKKKEYIKCLENRVAVLENQNKALIEELKTLKELYCQQKTE